MGGVALTVSAIEPESGILETAYPMVREFLREFNEVPRQSTAARLRGAHPLPAELRSLYQAAAGEVTVADSLASLGEDWLVLHAVPVGRDGAEVDHIAMGPPGVFTVSVRHHPGQALWVGGGVVLVDGERMRYIRSSEFEAVRAAQLMSDAVGERVEATPCLVVVGARSMTVERPPRRVAIVTPRELRPWLKSLPQVFTRDQLHRFRAVASEAATWHDIGNPTADVQDRLDRFQAIHALVNQARHVRLTWITGMLVLAWIVAIVGIGGFTTNLLVR